MEQGAMESARAAPDQQQQQQEMAQGPPQHMAPPMAGAPPQQQAANPREKLMRNAVAFLKNPQVRASSMARRVNFLKSKGLTPEEIHEAFQKAGQTEVTLDQIKNVINNRGATSTAAESAGTAAPPPPPQQPVQYAGQPPQYAPHPQQQYAPQPPPYHPQQYAAPLPPTPPPAKVSSWTWKDYFIGTTLAAVGVTAVVKLASPYLPFEVVAKQTAGGEGKRGKGSKQRPVRYASDSAEDEPALAQRSQSAIVAPTPAAAVLAAAPEQPKAAADAELRLKEANSQLDLLRSEVNDVKTELDKARREKAELAVGNGKLKGQIQQLNRTIERDARELKRMTEEVETMRQTVAEAEAKVSASASPAPQTDGEPAGGPQPAVEAADGASASAAGSEAAAPAATGSPARVGTPTVSPDPATAPSATAPTI